MTRATFICGLNGFAGGGQSGSLRVLFAARVAHAVRGLRHAAHRTGRPAAAGCVPCGYRSS